MREYDVIFYDETGCGEISAAAMSRPMGGANVHTFVLATALANLGLNVHVEQGNWGEELSCRALVLHRWSRAPSRIYVREATVVAAHDFADSRYDHHMGRRFVCVSRFQADNFRHLGETSVIAPPVGPHVWEVGPSHVDMRRWIFASNVDKGLGDTIDAWVKSPQKARGGVLAITCRGTEPAPQVAAAGIDWLGDLSPSDMAVAMSECHGMFYRNSGSAECFPVVIAMARVLGLELDIKCVGHQVCGVQEAMMVDLAHLTPTYAAAQWIKELGL